MAPQAIVRCHDPAQVAEAITLAHRSGSHAVPRSGGHCFAGRSSTEGIVLDVGPMRSVSVSGDVAALGAGACLGDIYDRLGERTIPAGCGETVGIAGLTLGGGLGILGRTHGLTCDQLLAAQVVLADGRVVDCDEHHDPDLFWALRGAGGGQFGVVTSLTFRTVAAPAMTAFHLTWPHTEAARVIEAWTETAPDAPDELAASLLVTDTAERTTVTVFGALAGTESDAVEVLEPLVDRAGTAPASTVIRHLPFRATKRFLAEVGERLGQPGIAVSKSEFFARPLPADAIAALVAHLDRDRVPGQARELDFTPWGGAYGRTPTHATAFAHRDARFLLKQAVNVPAGASLSERDGARRWLTRSWSTVHPWGAGGVYPNFPDPDLAGWATAYHGANYPRLRAVKGKYDPRRFFRFHQSIAA